MERPQCPTEGCRESPLPLAVHSNVESSEWYFGRCHRSLPMDRETAGYFFALEQRKAQ